MKNKDNKLSGKIKIRRLKLEDANDLFEIYSDAEAMKFRSSPPFQNIEEAFIFIRNQKLKTGTILTIRKAIEVKETGSLLGSVMIKYDVQNVSECEIGYSIGKKYWGQGFGSEVVSTLVQLLKRKAGLERVKAWTNIANISSIKILEKNGFQKTEQDEFVDCFLYWKHLK